MATNPYFNHLKSKTEQSFYEDLVVENIKNTGVDVYYIPREYFEIDSILGEPSRSTFKSAYKIEVYIKDITGYSGQGDLMTKFGLAMDDETRIEISKKRFGQLGIPDRQRPREGDLIYVGDIENGGYGSFTNSFFEIMYVEHESPFWALGKYFTYELKCKLFTFSYEKFNTGNSAIDTINSITNKSDIDIAINQALQIKEKTLVDFSEKNPFGDL
jgi:hypothetical protein